MYLIECDTVAFPGRHLKVKPPETDDTLHYCVLLCFYAASRHYQQCHCLFLWQTETWRHGKQNRAGDLVSHAFPQNVYLNSISRI